MKINKEKAIIVYNILDKSNLGKCKDEDKIAIVRIMKALKPYANEYDDFLKDASIKLRPEGFDAIEEKISKGSLLTASERMLLDKYNADVMRCVSQDFNGKEIEVDFKPLSEDAFNSLIIGNAYKGGEVMALYDTIGE